MTQSYRHQQYGPLAPTGTDIATVSSLINSAVNVEVAARNAAILAEIAARDSAIAANAISDMNNSRAYAESLVVGMWEDRGNFDASVNAFPSTGGSGLGGIINKGDIWTVSIAGTVGGVPVVNRETIRALINIPGQIAANWAIGSANTSIADSLTLGITGVAPSQNIVKAALNTETTRATNAENILTTNLTNEINRAIAAEATISAQSSSYALTNTLPFSITSVLTNCGLFLGVGRKAIVRSILVCNVSFIEDAVSATININGIGTPIANAIPIVAGGSVELLYAPKVMSTNDALLFKSLSASNGLQVTISYEVTTDTNLINAGAVATTALTTAFVSAAANATIIDSCLVANITTANYSVDIAWVNAANVVQTYLVKNYVVPVNSSIEVMQNAFRLPTGHKLQVLCDVNNAVAIYISGRNK